MAGITCVWQGFYTAGFYIAGILYRILYSQGFYIGTLYSQDQESSLV